MGQKNAQRRGRPRSFDENEALERAIQVFWEKGYDGVTIDDLVDGMGVGRPSLYAIFGPKQALFMRCLRTYAERKGTLAAKALLGPSHVLDAIRAFLRYSVESATERDSAWGCLLICVAPLVKDAKVRAFLVRAATDSAALLEERLRKAVESGELPADFPVATRARQILDLARGLTMRAQIATPRKELLADAESSAELVLPLAGHRGEEVHDADPLAVADHAAVFAIGDMEVRYVDGDRGSTFHEARALTPTKPTPCSRFALSPCSATARPLVSLPRCDSAAYLT
jgi:AcrR family transcriptional regulator